MIGTAHSKPAAAQGPNADPSPLGHRHLSTEFNIGLRFGLGIEQ
jgi:hypothetical protein